MAQMCHVKANSEASLDCRSSGVLATDAHGDYILYLQGGTSTHPRSGVYSDCWQILLNGDGFSSGKVFKH